MWQAVGVMFSYLRMKQLECCDFFFKSRDMLHRCQQFHPNERAVQTDSGQDATNLTLEAQSNELLALYGSNAVYAAEHVHVY